MPKPKLKEIDVAVLGRPNPSRLTDEECDFIIQRVLWKLRDATNPIDFFRGMGRGIVFEVSAENRANVRNMIRWLARGDG